MADSLEELVPYDVEKLVKVLQERAEKRGNAKVLEKIVHFIIPSIQASLSEGWYQADEIVIDILVFLELPQSRGLYNFERVDVHGSGGYHEWQRKDYQDYYWVLQGEEAFDS